MNKNGFTLLGMIITVAILAIVLAAAALVFMA
ncbi:prepilin-type N-terminal cleavage/methylation domain-containing protein [Photobacterium kishitanii]